MKNRFYLIIAGCSTAVSSAGWADGAAAPKEGGLGQMLVIIGMAFVFFYFIMWRPEQKRRKKMEQQRNSMKIGDRVTAMGIVGTLSQIQETTIILKMVDGSKVEMLKSCITDVQSQDVEEKK